MRRSIKVVVLMGGPSGEHDVSLKSGRGIADALLERQFPVESIAIPSSLSVGEACEFTRRVLQHAFADVVFIALHGTFGEDGTIQHVCEDLHLAYTGSDAHASHLGMDKVASRKRFAAAGLLVPRWALVNVASDEAVPPAGFTYPLVIKPVSQGSSLGVSLVRRSEDLASAMAGAARYDHEVLVEEFVSGRELTVGILDTDPLPIVEIRPRQPFFDFTAKYTPGSTEYLVPAPLTTDVAKAVQEAARQAHRALGCRHVSRVDLILRDRQAPVILEINTIPGFTPTSLLPKAAACAGLSYEELCERLVLMASRDDSALRVAGGRQPVGARW